MPIEPNKKCKSVSQALFMVRAGHRISDEDISKILEVLDNFNNDT